MTNEDVKEALLKYHDYKRRVENANLELIAIITKQTKTGGSIIKIPENPTDRTHFQLKCIEEKDTINRKVHYWQDMILLAEGFINSLPEPYRSMVRDKYVNRLCDYKMEVKYHYDRKQIWRIIRKLIERYVEQT